MQKIIVIIVVTLVKNYFIWDININTKNLSVAVLCIFCNSSESVN